MLRIFRKTNGKAIDILSYTLKQVQKYPDLKIYVGGDSKLRGDGTIVYYTVVAYRYGSRGVHYVYNKEVVTQKLDRFNRLMGEVERIMTFATWFSENSPIRLHAIDFDLNQNTRYYSNKLVNLATGWGSSLGIQVRTKPDEVVASKAADYLTNRGAYG